MKKLFYTALIILTALSTVHAQDTLNASRSQGYNSGSGMNRTFIWSIGVEPSIPLGRFHDYTNFGLGGFLQGEYKPINWLGITLRAGYIDFFGKTTNGVKYSDFKYIPVMAGLKYYFTDVFYIHGEAGPGFGLSGLGTSFWYGGGLGLMLGRGFDMELKYTGWKQNVVFSGTSGYNNGGGNNGGYTGGGNNGGNTGGGVYGGGGYGGHYPVIGLRLAYNF